MSKWVMLRLSSAFDTLSFLRGTFGSRGTRIGLSCLSIVLWIALGVWKITSTIRSIICKVTAETTGQACRRRKALAGRTREVLAQACRCRETLRPIGKTLWNWLIIDLVVILIDWLIAVLKLTMWWWVVIDLIFDQNSDIFWRSVLLFIN